MLMLWMFSFFLLCTAILLLFFSKSIAFQCFMHQFIFISIHFRYQSHPSSAKEKQNLWSYTQRRNGKFLSWRYKSKRKRNRSITRRRNPADNHVWFLRNQEWKYHISFQDNKRYFWRFCITWIHFPPICKLYKQSGNIYIFTKKYKIILFNSRKIKKFINERYIIFPICWSKNIFLKSLLLRLHVFCWFMHSCINQYSFSM